MNVEGVHLSLPSTDLKASLQFYVEDLHFNKVFDLPQYCTVQLDRFFLSFVPADGACMPIHGAGRGWLFSVQVTDINAYYERIKAGGRVRFEQELALLMPGVWQFSLLDNNGYYVGFSQPNRSA